MKTTSNRRVHLAGCVGLAALCCALAARAQGTDELPPGHPKVPAPSSTELPPGHPKVPAPSSPELPPGHPKIAPASSSELPPGHPAIGPAPGGGSPKAPPMGSPSPMPAGHPPMREGASPPNADELMKRLDAQTDLKTREKSFEVAAALGKLYYSNARWSDAAEFLGQASAKADHARQIFVARKKGSAAAPPADCANKDLAVLTQLMDARVAAKDPASAAACAAAAMPSVAEVDELRANALALAGDLRTAAATYERALQVDPARPASLYGHAMALMETRPDDAAGLKAARQDLTALLAAPVSATAEARAMAARVDQAIAVGGFSKLLDKEAKERKAKGVPNPPFLNAAANGAPRVDGPNMSSEQMKAMQQAVQNTPVTPEMEKGFKELLDEAEGHLAAHRFQEALDAYKRVMPFQPNNGRVRAGMAWTMISLNRQPMADRVWGVAVGGDPAAVDALGDALKAKGDAQGARAVWTKLKESAPDYAASSKLDAKLK